MSEPYIEDGWLCEPCEPDYAPGISQAIPGSWSKPLVNLTELDGYDEMIAAAEQRGAERGWDEAMTAQIQRLISGDPDVERFQMPANPYRADRIEGEQ